VLRARNKIRNGEQFLTKVLPGYDTFAGEGEAMTRRRWIADDWDETSAWLRGEQAAHLVRVLRAQTGMECDVVAGDHVWRAVIAEVHEDAVRFARVAELEADAALPVTLLVAIFKFDRMEWILEKATELGAQRFIPIIARRSEKHLVKAAPARVERWRRIVIEAAKQSRRSDVPAVEDVWALPAAARSKPTDAGLNLLLAERERSTTLYAALQPLLAMPENPIPAIQIAIGPEGGWAEEELSLFVGEGWRPVTLGPRILRAETAGITAMAVVAALLG
jgi:16S rRNA (uracil1498-N3)-methyltransferase